MIEFSEVLAETGDFGRFQIQLLLMLAVPTYLINHQIFGQVFMALNEAHHCSVAWVKNPTFNLSTAEQLLLSVPLDAAGNPESCLMFRPPPDNASLEDILSHRFNETQPCETGWEYPEDRAPSLMNEVGCPFAGLCPVSGLSIPLPGPLLSFTGVTAPLFVNDSQLICLFYLFIANYPVFLFALCLNTCLYPFSLSGLSAHPSIHLSLTFCVSSCRCAQCLPFFLSPVILSLHLSLSSTFPSVCPFAFVF